MKFKPNYKSVRLVFGADARKALIQGATRLSEAASKTLGPGVSIEYLKN